MAAPRKVHERIRTGYADLRRSMDDGARTQAIDKLLSALGTYRYHVGRGTPEGRIAANRMNALRARRAGLTIVATTMPQLEEGAIEQDNNVTIHERSVPWD